MAGKTEQRALAGNNMANGRAAQARQAMKAARTCRAVQSLRRTPLYSCSTSAGARRAGTCAAAAPRSGGGAPAERAFAAFTAIALFWRRERTGRIRGPPPGAPYTPPPPMPPMPPMAIEGPPDS